MYGGKIRRILAYVDPHKLIARGLSPLDVLQAIQRSNVLIPTGNARLGNIDYQVDAQGMLEHVRDLKNIPIKIGTNDQPILLKDVAEPKDTNQIQTNIVRIGGRRQVYIPIYRQPGSNTIAIVEGIRASLASIQSSLPSDMRLRVVMDQSVFVRKAIQDLGNQAWMGALLVALIVLLFLRDLRSTLLILVALPLSIVAAFGALYFANQSINTMTLGGIALAIGILIDQSIVVLENITRHLREGKTPTQAALLGAGEVARPVLIGTITVMAVFLPVLFLAGLGRFLFAPLSLAVGFCVFSSYAIAFTVIPALAMLLLRPASPSTNTQAHPSDALSTDGRTDSSDAPPNTHSLSGLERAYLWVLPQTLRWRWLVLVSVTLLFVCSLLLLPRIGAELFPSIDSGQFQLLVRGPSGLRIEEMEKRLQKVEAFLESKIPPSDRELILTNIGVLLDWPAAYTPNAGGQDAFLNIQLKESRGQTTQYYVTTLRKQLKERFPDLEFSFDTGGLLTAALNFGLPSPINLQITGSNLQKSTALAHQIKERIARIPGIVDIVDHANSLQRPCDDGSDHDGWDRSILRDLVCGLCECSRRFGTRRVQRTVGCGTHPPSTDLNDFADFDGRPHPSRARRRPSQYADGTSDDRRNLGVNAFDLACLASDLPPLQRKTTDRSRLIMRHLLWWLCLAVLSGCSASTSPTTTRTDVLRVRLGRALRADLIRKVELVSILRPYEQVEIFARVDGYLQSVSVDRGSTVRKGALLAVIDIPILRRSLLTHKAQSAAQDALVAQALAESQHRNMLYQRLHELWKSSPGATSRFRVDDAQGQALVAKARVQTAKANALIAKAKIAQIQTQLAFAQLRAPFDGVITERNVHPGALIHANQTKTPLFRMVSTKRLRGVLDIPAPDAPFVRPNLPLQLFLDALPNTPPLQAKILRNAGSLDPISRTLRVEFDVENTQQTLYPEMYGRVRLDLEPRNGALVIPQDWMLIQKQQRSVFLLRQGVLQQVKLQTGIETIRAGQTLVEILSGLQGNEDIVTHPNSSMADGLSAAAQ